MTNKELGQAARNALKTKGYNLKDISVTTKDAGYEQILIVRLKSENIDPKAVSLIVGQFKAIDYDYYAQEILAGGNTFVRVIDINGYSY